MWILNTNKGTENFGLVVTYYGRNQKVIAEYIQNQLQDDRVADQLIFLRQLICLQAKQIKK